MDKFIIYVLESELDGVWYLGFSTNLAVRLDQHNAGKSRFTKGHLPWKVIYSEEIRGTRQDARSREKYLKSAAGKRFIKKRVESAD